MWMAGGIGLLAGVLLVLLLPRILPFAANTYVASLVIGLDRVSVGEAMTRAVDPAKARNIEWSSQFYETNAGGIGSCFEAARQSGTDQQCSIIVQALAH